MSLLTEEEILAAAENNGCHMPLRSGSGDCRVPQFFSVSDLCNFARAIEAAVLKRLCDPAAIAEWQLCKKQRDDLAASGQRLALELECLILDTKDTAIVSKWWDTASEALNQWREILEGSAA